MKRRLIYPFVFLMICSCSGTEDEGDTISETEETDETQYKAGKEVYENRCVVCHQTDGSGIEGTYPPLANSDYMLEDRARAIRQMMNGSDGEITVNGVKYNGIMPPQMLSKEEMVDVLNYVFNNWGNEAEEFTLEEVETVLQ